MNFLLAANSSNSMRLKLTTTKLQKSAQEAVFYSHRKAWLLLFSSQLASVSDISVKSH